MQINVTLLDWCGVNCAVVHTTQAALGRFLANLSRRNDPAKVKATWYIQEVIPAGQLRDGLIKSAIESGAVWLTGLSAMKF